MISDTEKYIRSILGGVLETKIELIIQQRISQGFFSELKAQVLTELNSKQEERDRKIDAILKIAEGVKELLQ